jgi:hypothetical protein
MKHCYMQVHELEPRLLKANKLMYCLETKFAEIEKDNT